MDATPARPTLLSAARNFVRKSAGTAVLAIAPLAAVAIAPGAKAAAVTTFGTPGVNFTYGSGSALVYDSFPSGSKFHFPGTATNDLTTTRLGVDGSFFTSGSGTATVTMTVFSAIASWDIPDGTVIPLAYDFSLAKQSGIAGNVNWHLAARIAGDNYEVLGTGALTTGSATFTGSGNYTTLNVVPGNNTTDFELILTLSYSTLTGDLLAVHMNSASQGFTINAQAIPEPSTYVMIFGLGALGFAMLRRSRRGAA